MNFKHFFIITIVASIFVRCSTSHKLNDFSTNKIVFGSEGGVAGIGEEYVLHYNGLIEKINILTQESDYAIKVSDLKAKKLFMDFLNNGLDTLEYADPGNMSFFVGYKNDSITKKIIWGGEGSPPETARATYTNLLQLINNK